LLALFSERSRIVSNFLPSFISSFVFFFKSTSVMKRGTAWREEDKHKLVKHRQVTSDFVLWAMTHEENQHKKWIDPANRMTEEAVSQAEAKWGIVFPPDYRAFLVLGGPGSELVRWDGTQDKRIAELYRKLQESGASPFSSATASQ
jgi:hypothetical protein